MGSGLDEARKILVFDTETTGMVAWKTPDEAETQPHLVQLGMLLVDTLSWKALSRHSCLVQLPDGVVMDPGALQAHGIDEDHCRTFGIPARVACELFCATVRQADLVVAHNLRFDRIVMEAACQRDGVEIDWVSEVPGYCTMESSTPIVRLPGKKGHKWPTLAEAYAHFTGETLHGAHDALVDAEACLAIYQAIREGEPIPS
ncbi:MAG: 3'-5' exonuclease [Myxococcota bacterium]|nr:3'-5' exonuclease [Myxococcota bacterium]